MPLSMSQASVSIYAQQLNSLLGLLDKAVEHCKTKGVDPSELISAQLAPDMFPFSRQIQIATDQAKGATARLSGRENPKFEDTEKTFDELKARVKKTLDFIKSVPAQEIDGSEEKDITLPIGGQPRTLKGQLYLVRNSLPNFFFHVTTAYDILRHKGVEIGKRDYLGSY